MKSIFTLFLQLFPSYRLVILITAYSGGILAIFDSFYRTHSKSNLNFLDFTLSFGTFCSLSLHCTMISHLSTPKDPTPLENAYPYLKILSKNFFELGTL